MQNKEKIEKIYLKIIESGVYLTLFTPLIVIKNFFFPFVTPKTIFFRAIVDIIFIAYILLALSNQKYRPRISVFTLSLTIFIIILFLTSIMGANFSRSFWSVFERMTGLATFFHLFIFYIILTSVFRERRDWEKILSVSILVATLSSLYVLFSKNPINRGGGTIGNSSFFSAYVLFNFFFALILAIIKNGKWRTLYIFSLIIFLFSLFFNPGGFTRGAVSAFGIGMTLFFLGLMFFLGNRLIKKLTPIVLILAILIGIFIIKNFHFNGGTFDIKNIPDRSRQIVWLIGWQAWQERLLFGWGLDNFNIPFFKYYNPELPVTGDIWYDRVHNIVLDIAVSSGIIGLLSYLSIFFLAIYGLVRFLSKREDRKETILFLGIISLLITYFLQNLWVFDMISSYLMFFLTLAFINFLIFSRREKIIPLSSFFGWGLIVLAVLALIFINIQPARAAKFIIEGGSSSLEKNIIAFQKAFKSSPIVRFEGPEQFSLIITALSQQPGQKRELLKEGFQLLEEEFKESISQNFLDYRLYLFLGRHYNAFYEITHEEEKLDLAQKALEKAINLSPDNQQAYFIFAQTKFSQGRPEEALEFLKRAKDLEPRFMVARWYLIRGYRLAKKYELAFSELKEVEKMSFDWQKNPEYLKEGIEILKGVNQDISSLIPLYEKGVEFFPQDLYLWEDLVNAYISTNQIKKAKSAAERFRNVNPQFSSQVEDFLNKLKAMFPNEALN